MTATPMPVWFHSVAADPGRDEVTITFTPVLGPDHRVQMPFHEFKALHDAIARTLVDNPPACRRRQWEMAAGARMSVAHETTATGRSMIAAARDAAMRGEITPAEFRAAHGDEAGEALAREIGEVVR